MTLNLAPRWRRLVAALLLGLVLLPLRSVAAQDGTAPSAVSSSSAVIAIDSPAAGAQWTLGQDVLISGWAADPSGPTTGIAAVYVYLDAPSTAGGLRLKEATYGKARADVAAGAGRVDWTNVGYELTWTVANVAPGTHTLYVYADPIASTPDNYSTVTVNVSAAALTIASPPPPAIPVVTPNPGPNPVATLNPASGSPVAASPSTGVLRFLGPTQNEIVGRTITVSMLAADCAAGGAPIRVRLFDGSPSGPLLGTATEGLSRELAAPCPGQTGTANILFNLSLDTHSLPDGPHALVAVADMSDGPVTASLGLRIFNSGR